MIPEYEIQNFSSAIQDFRRARRQANLKEIIARLRGESNQLLSFEEVRKALKLQATSRRELKEIPLDAIVGSVGRYADFTREFLPRESVNPDRWAKVKVATSGLAGLPPIEVYQIGDVYFVQDGNHRVSVARQLGATYIQAFVTPVKSRVALSPDIQPDDIILIAEYHEFLEKTRIDELLPEVELKVTAPGQYRVLLEHIEVHRYFMGLEQKRPIPYQEAVLHWYEKVYTPVVELIRSLGILHYFPDRTETDLYLWISRHRADLEKQLGWQVHEEYVLGDLVEKFGDSKGIATKLFELIIPSELEVGPPPGTWRVTRTASGEPETLFQDILVPLNGKPDGWHALEQALIIAKREQAQLHGLHVVEDEKEISSQHTAHIKKKFNQRCKQEGILGELTIISGGISEVICAQSRFTDMIVLNLSHPPVSLTMKKLSSGFRQIIQKCPRPILATPKTATSLEYALLAFDGSPKAREALFISTYLATKWNIKLTVVNVQEVSNQNNSPLAEARLYLEKRGVSAQYLQSSGDTSVKILEISTDIGCDFLIMGGYGHKPILEAVLGSTVDQLLRYNQIPMLICH